MRRAPLIRGLLAVLALAAGPAAAATLDLAFMPPEVEPQEICAQPPVETIATDGATDDAIFLQYLRRDIHDLSAEDADRWFDFIEAMIVWEVELDPGFTGSVVKLIASGTASGEPGCSPAGRPASKRPRPATGWRR